MTEVNRCAKVGDTIKVVNEYDPGWRTRAYPLGSTWTVSKIWDEPKGLVACNRNEFCISARDYIVIEKGSPSKN